jgi:hypothetical protein
MARDLEYPGERSLMTQARADVVHLIREALRIRGFEVARDDAFSAWSAYSAGAGWSWVRVPEDTYEILMRIRPYLRPAAPPASASAGTSWN